MRSFTLLFAATLLLAATSSPPSPITVSAFNPIFLPIDIAAVGVAIGLHVHSKNLKNYHAGLEGQVEQLEDRADALQALCTQLRSCPVIAPVLQRRQIGLFAGGIASVAHGVNIHNRNHEIKDVMARKRAVEHRLYYLERWFANFRRSLTQDQLLAISRGERIMLPGMSPGGRVAAMTAGPVATASRPGQFLEQGESTHDVEVIEDDGDDDDFVEETTTRHHRAPSRSTTVTVEHKTSPVEVTSTSGQRAVFDERGGPEETSAEEEA